MVAKRSEIRGVLWGKVARRLHEWNEIFGWIWMDIQEYCHALFSQQQHNSFWEFYTVRERLRAEEIAVVSFITIAFGASGFSSVPEHRRIGIVIFQAIS